MPIRDEDYHTLSNAAYYPKPLKKFSTIYKDGKKDWTIVGNKNFKLHDVNTGFDAVVYKSGNEVVVAFRGTQGDDLLGEGLTDLETDIDYIMGGRKVYEPVTSKLGVDITRDESGKIQTKSYVENQFREADVLVQQVKTQFPKANISLTGHSLGGALASYTAVTNNLKAVTYSSPSVVKLLPKKEQDKVKKGEYDKKVINYVHPKDSIGAGGIREYDDHIGSTYYIGSIYELENRDLIDRPIKRLIASIGGDEYHSLQHYKFDQFGNINNPVLTLASTGLTISQSPRFFSTELTSIEVTPADLTEISSELNSIAERVKSLCSTASSSINALDNIKVNDSLQNDALQSIKSFESWFEERTTKLSKSLGEAADSYVKADVLPNE